MKIIIYLAVFILLSLNVATSQTLTVGSTGDYATLRLAAQSASPGDTILLQAEVFSNGTQSISNLAGTKDAPIVIMAETMHQTIFRGGSSAIHFISCEYIEINGIVIEQQTVNGINIDDGGDYTIPSNNITIRNCIFRDLNSTGNADLLKMSGTDNFKIENCQFIDGSDGGSGIDFVGCHLGIIQDCVFDNVGTTGIQCKGGSQNLTIRRNILKNMSQRAINIGGNTDLEFFRPPLPNPIANAFEAADIHVFSNIFIGSRAPIAFVGSIRAKVYNNTFYKPDHWVMRILQENTTSGFLDCANNEFKNNIVYLESDLTEVNIGDNTEPSTFSFANNLWHNESSTSWTPTLPVTDMNQAIANPLFENIALENFHINAASPATGAGLNALVDTDFDNEFYNVPPSIGAFEGNIPDGDITANYKEHLKKSVFLYPNPATNDFIINSDLEIEKVIIYDTKGVLVKEIYNTNNISLDNHKGIFLIKVQFKGDKQVIKKITIH